MPDIRPRRKSIPLVSELVSAKNIAVYLLEHFPDLRILITSFTSRNDKNCSFFLNLEFTVKSADVLGQLNACRFRKTAL
jgi:hypothetical protein